MLSGEKLERHERRAAAGRALVLDPPPEELGLLAEAELPDRAIRHDPIAVVARSSGRLELVRPRGAQAGELALLALLGEGLSLRRCLLERQLAEAPLSERGAGPTYCADGRNSRPVLFCSKMCADQPATREHANIAGASAGGMLATSSTTAE